MKRSEFFEQLKAEGLGDVVSVEVRRWWLDIERGGKTTRIEAATAGKYTKGNLRAIVEYFKAKK